MQISVVMPVWNAESTLEKSVTTILNQTLRDFELIIVDDGSVDQTPIILERLSSLDSRICVLHQSNSGIVAALSLGIEHARGEYIARADGDDLYEAERLELQLGYLEAHPAVVLVCCNYFLCYPNGDKRLMTLPEDHTSILKRLLRRNDIMHSSVMLRRSAVIKAGGYLEKWRHLEDYELWFRIARVGQIASVPLPLAHYRLHSGGISQKMETYQVRRGVLIRLHAIFRRQVPFSWIRFLPMHVAKALVPNTLLRFVRRVTHQSKGITTT